MVDNLVDDTSKCSRRVDGKCQAFITKSRGVVRNYREVLRQRFEKVLQRRYEKKTEGLYHPPWMDTH